jgi:hypothetical protein
LKVTRPDLPKRLASRIRAAQSTVEQERFSVIGTERTISDEQARVAEFEADPEAFAGKYYRGHGVDSYPVTTTMARTRERLEYNVRRQPVRIERLAEAERTLATVEEEVLREVQAMRPSTGRVPWPPPLKPMKRFREARAEEERHWQERDRSEREAYAVKEAAEHERKQIEQERLNDLEIAEYHRQFALLPREEQARQRDASQKIIDLVESGKISKSDLFSAVMKRYGPSS